MSDPLHYFCYSCQKEKAEESEMIELAFSDYPICKECWADLDKNHRAWISILVHEVKIRNLPDFRSSSPN